jgi:glycosyltransferase involved in cell wall biosynthesis
MSHAMVAIPGLDRIGGAERQAMLLAMGLRRRGWRVTMVALSGSGGSAATELRDAGVDFMSLHMRRGLADPRGWIRIHRWLRREQPDVVHAHLPHAAWLARWSRVAAPVPVVIDTLHSSAIGKLGRRFGYACSRWLPDRVTAVSRATADSHLAAGMVDEKDVSVVANGIEVNQWRPDKRARAAARRELGIQREFVWIAVGRLEAVKDYPNLLAAMTHLPEKTKLLVLGAGPLEAHLVELAAQLGLDRRVRFLGFEPDVAHWMHAADAFVLSSRLEGLPMVLLESGASGLPAVATDVPGTREAMVNGETGWLAPAGDPEKLAAAMVKLMRMPAKERRAMGARARRYVAEHFSLDAVLDQWVRLYEELLRRKGAKRQIGLEEREDFRRQSAIRV